MKQYIIFCAIYFISFHIYAQGYINYFTGNQQDLVTMPMGGVCLMGGATESDEAMVWFLKRAEGGDILVLRASGSDGYNDYLFNELGVEVNSVETIVFESEEANEDPYILDKIEKAEAIWFAGGNQWNYVSYWRDSSVGEKLRNAINLRNIVIGGTSAGMAILGGYYFTAYNGTVTSNEAISNPYNENMTVSNSTFLDVPGLENVITDTHYDDPDRRARHMAFIARELQDHGNEIYGIACDEYTAVCIDEELQARVFGGYPDYDDNAYFLQINCDIVNNNPEVCEAGQELVWYQGGKAVKVYNLKGTIDGANVFDLVEWKLGAGGTWQDWSISNGALHSQEGQAVDCETLDIKDDAHDLIRIFPNPTHGYLHGLEDLTFQARSIKILNVFGDFVSFIDIEDALGSDKIDISYLNDGLYWLEVSGKNQELIVIKIVILKS